MIYFISDYHFGHKDILEYGERPFNSIEEMNDAIINRYNQTVTSEDTVYFLGDFCLGSPERIKENLSKFKKVKQLILIKGNHDRIKTADEARALGFDDMVEKMILNVDEINIGLSHYPFKRPGEMPGKSNFKPDEVDVLVHGHAHQLYKTRMHESGKLMINVSCEVIDYKPISLDEILVLIRAKAE